MSLPIIIGISGASGAVYAVRLLEVLAELGRETFLVVSKAGQRTIEEELGMDIKEIRDRATRWFPIADIGASIASGSVRTAGMIVAPCSIRTAAEIATGNTSTLLTRAADVVLKERRRLVLMVRETPLHTGHLRTLTQLSEMNAIIAPPVPAFYAKPASLDDVVDHGVGRILDLFDIDSGKVRRWKEGDGGNEVSPPA
ncbi:UbiX family flavin prenyltransferase [Sphingobium cloacae]|uniref:Flavin prenyltransferase UbiX n=1 Tax=Sphingobium cloacae TaxID=120107 RepID=A0A1E1F6P5_9SPHN|nr:UbiX family flavin prenyltransferase [Sphingobium cloacae]BAV66180.1 3-octaprenyl-4-hydroxybenzoate carboxy-lyase [Sphingobium cloacae]